MKNESPYTKVPNSILDFEGLDVYEFRLLIFILRKTIGFNKKSDGISLSQFVKATGISKDKVIKSLENLQKRKFISIQKQTLKNGGKSFNRYISLVDEKDYLVCEKDKGSTSQRLGLVCEKDIQKENNTKENRQKREREIINNIYFSLSDNEQLKEIDRYIDDLILVEGYIKNPKAFDCNYD
ncbi:replication protein [Aliarcobacter butzleri]